MDEITRQVLEEERVEPGHFTMADIPELTSAGRWREALLPVSPEIAPGDGRAIARFFLRKGGYATTVLREYMKADPRDMI
jgi:tRNA pseudouridine13 synthase